MFNGCIEIIYCLIQVGFKGVTEFVSTIARLATRFMSYVKVANAAQRKISDTSPKVIVMQHP